jgi:hypothetical protein
MMERVLYMCHLFVCRIDIPTSLHVEINVRTLLNVEVIFTPHLG